MKAVDKFEYRRGYKVATYASFLPRSSRLLPCRGALPRKVWRRSPALVGLPHSKRRVWARFSTHYAPPLPTNDTPGCVATRSVEALDQAGLDRMAGDN
jgi:hypothetical protein